MSVTATSRPQIRRSSPRRLYVLTPIGLFALAGVGILGAKARVPENEVAPGVQVGSLKLGGKSLEDARTLIQQWCEARQATKLHLHFAEETHIGKTWTADAHKLGLGFDVAATLDDAAKAGREGMLGQVSHLLTGSRTILVPAHISVDADQLRANVKQIAYKVNRKPRNARLKLNGTDIVDYIHDRPGLSVDVDGSINAITQAWTQDNGQDSGSRLPDAGTESSEQGTGNRAETSAPAAVDPNAHQKPGNADGENRQGNRETEGQGKPSRVSTGSPEEHNPPSTIVNSQSSTLDVELAATATPAAITYADVKQINGVLGKMQTDIGGTANRHSNVALAASHINGTLLKPGEIFSYNKIVGPRDREHDFKEAPEIVRGVLKPGIGGGVCQVSSTLFNAVLTSNMKIVDRSHHAFPVHYVSKGLDATVVDGDIDFKFQNSMDTPVYIYGRGHNGVLTFRIYGKTMPSLKVEMVRGNYVQGDYGTETETDSSLPAGHREVKVPGHPRIDVTWYRVVKENGTVIKREPITTHYRAIPAVILVGTAPAKPRSTPPAGTVRSKSAAKPAAPANPASPAADDGAATPPTQ